jgi:ATP-dependent DNA ligase
MPKDLFSLPTAKKVMPAGPDWIHEVKYDGYRLRVERNGDRVRLLSKSGLDWTKRYPWIVEKARKIRQKQFILDGEAVVLGVDGISNFNVLHSRQYDEEVLGRRTARCRRAGGERPNPALDHIQVCRLKNGDPQLGQLDRAGR